MAADQGRVQVESEIVAVQGIQGRILSVLSDENWHSLPEIASKADVSKSSASKYLYFMLSRGEHYRDSATDYEALSVQRNAPRWIKALTRFGFISPAQA